MAASPLRPMPKLNNSHSCSTSFSIWPRISQVSNPLIKMISSWSPSLVVNLIILSMTLYKTFQTQRQFGSVPISQRMRKDGIVYFAIVVVVNCLSFGFATRKSYLSDHFRLHELTPRLTRIVEKDPSLQTVTLPASITITSVCCSRLVLSLRSHGSKPGGTSRLSTQVVSVDNVPASGRQVRFGSR